MPRDLPLGNGRLLLNFDKSYNLRDIYWPHVGQELHTAGDISHTGVWVQGQFAWFDSPDWQREMVYDSESLVSHVTLYHPRLQVQIVVSDFVDFNRDIFFRHFSVQNQADVAREVRFFTHYDWHIWNAADGNTVFFHPDVQAMIAYKERAYFLMNGQVLLQDRAVTGLSSWAIGVKEFNGSEGTWRDAEDGVLGCNPISQGSVDCTLALHIPSIEPQATAEAYHWLAASANIAGVIELNKLVIDRSPLSFLNRARRFWSAWVNKEQQGFADLPSELVDLYKRSLLILRTQIDNDGAILAANDADVEHFNRDSYSYMWPRDGSLVANALSHAGYSETSSGFYLFCASVLTPDGFLLHKYRPDRSWGSSWHPWIDKHGRPQLPIQEDETALALFSLWQHYSRFHDIEFVAPLYHSFIARAADFLTDYIEPTTRLPMASYDLWEERHGILSYTTATVYAGLMAARQFAILFGEDDQAAKYEQAAQGIKAAALQYLWDEEKGHFLRMITVDPDGTIHRDATLDSSLCGLFQFGMFDANDPHMVSTMQHLEQTLWVKTEVGGMARYENDSYYQVTQDISLAQGNPWFICTLWLAQYRIARATTIDGLHEALPLLQWVRKHALPSGVMSEQIHPFTSEPLSVSPLTWSHAEYVLAVRWYLGRYRRFQDPHTHEQIIYR